jgi:hypothetical protein
MSEDLINWTDPVKTVYYSPWSYHTTPGPGSVGDLGGATAVLGYPAAYYLYAGPNPEAGKQFSINIRCLGPGTIYFGLQDPTDFHEMSTNGPLAFYQPEPATICLLALGGLFLRRRK